MSNLTAEQLISAIHSADNLNELKRLVGPPQSEERRAAERLKQIDRIFDRWADKLDQMPPATKERFERLDREQTEFENKYC